MKKSLTTLLAAMLLLNGCVSVPSDDSVIAEAVYPEMAPYPREEDYIDQTTYEFDYEAYEADFTKWRETSSPGADTEAIVSEMAPFVQRTAAQLLSDNGGENRAYSPLNLYFALGMLAELTDGNSRDQVLDLVGTDDTEGLRNDIAALWESNYSDDGRVTSILANSLWLNENYSFKQPTLEILAKNYRASSYSGTMGSEDFNEVFRNWMNEQTGGLLEESVKKLGFTTQTVLALTSTIYFAAGWEEEFSALYFGGETNRQYATVNLSVPKFDVSSDIDLIGQLTALGVTDVFDPGTADFSPMTENADGLAVTEAKHAARVMIDEEGCLAAAYTVMMVEETVMEQPEEEIDLVFDRPFLFVITAKDDSVLFMGIVNDPAGDY